MSALQELLKQAKKTKKSIPESIIEQPVKPVVNEKLRSKLASLPSEISIKSSTSYRETTSRPNEIRKDKEIQPKVTKPLSFKKLMKLASNTKPKGLITKEAPIERQNHNTEEKDMGKRISLIKASMIDSNQHDAMNNSRIKHNWKSSITKRSLPNLGHRISKKNKIPDDLIKLNVKKRDLDSIEDIQNQILARKGIIKDPLKNSKAKEKIGTPSKPLVTTARMPKSSVVEANSKKVDMTPQTSYSTEIQNIFGYNRSKYVDEYSDDDMEVGFNDIEREEKKSLKIGKLEDAIEEKKRLERERRKQKYN